MSRDIKGNLSVEGTRGSSSKYQSSNICKLYYSNLSDLTQYQLSMFPVLNQCSTVLRMLLLTVMASLNFISINWWMVVVMDKTLSAEFYPGFV